jgi:hypothetical protein
MTQDQWITCNDPAAMLSFLQRGEHWGRRVLSFFTSPTRRVSPRKIRLFMCACCRRGCNLGSEEPVRKAVETSERYADGLAIEEELRASEEGAQDYIGGSFLAAGAKVATCNVWDAVFFEASVNQRRFAADLNTLADEPMPFDHQRFTARLELEQGTQSDLLRCIFNNPFRPITIEPFLSFAAVQMAQAIYDERAFDRLPLLGDALEESGVSDSELLAHCRADTPHARGCHVVDLILGKK